VVIDDLGPTLTRTGGVRRPGVTVARRGEVAPSATSEAPTGPTGRARAGRGRPPHRPAVIARGSAERAD
jgi:hypothetical protein